MQQMFVHNGCQYPADKLPEGVKPSDCQTLEDWFAENRTPSAGAADPEQAAAEQAAAEQAAAEQAAAEQAAAEQAAAEQAAAEQAAAEQAAAAEKVEPGAKNKREK